MKNKKLIAGVAIGLAALAVVGIIIAKKKKSNKSKVSIDLNDKNDICGLFLFDGKKDPALVDMPNIDTQLGFYFSK